MPKAIEISEENLEDLLAYDDLFVEYFNEFLALPVFPQPLHYNRLTSTFEEAPIQANESAHEGSGPFSPPPYGPTDEERERMLQWAKEERLPLFLRTQLFRELKLNKLLLRQLDDRHSASRRGSYVTLRGYSRQTETYVSSLSNSADNSANEATDLEDDSSDWGVDQRAQLFRYQRPGSRAISLPPRLQLPASMTPLAAGQMPNGGEAWRQSSSREVPAHQPTKVSRGGPKISALRTTGNKARQTPAAPSRDVTFDYEAIAEDKDTSSEEKTVTRSAKSSKRNGNRSTNPSHVTENDTRNEVSEAGDADARSRACSDFDAVFGEEEPDVADGEMFVAFADDVVSDSQTETDVRNLEGKHRMTLQQMKEQILGGLGGYKEFQDFLEGTSGEHLQSFWLDCENFKDTMEDYNESEIKAHRNRLFRDIQDKYKLKLTLDAKKQMLQTSASASQSHNIFIRTQYDVLRRLRAYWLPRFLIHKERMNELREKGQIPPEVWLSSHLKSMGQLDETMDTSPRPTTSFFFPSISLVNSMPVYPDQLLQIAATTSWEFVSKGGRRLDDRVKSAKVRIEKSPAQAQSVREKLIIALSHDKQAGSPFKNHLIKLGDPCLLSKLLFWEDVTEYGEAEDRSADRLLRMGSAWGIFNKYIALGSIHSIGVDPRMRDQLHSILLNTKDFVSVSLMDSAKEEAVEVMEKSWVRFLKEDAKKFYDCRLRDNESQASTADDFELIFDDNENLIVRGPRPWVRRYPPSTCSERGERLRTALSVAESIDEARRIEQRRRAKERRKIMEKERRKAIRNAKKRQQDAKKKVSFKPKQEGEEGEVGEDEPKEEEEQPQEEETLQEVEKQQPDFVGSVTNKGVMSLFKKYLSETTGREILNVVNLYLDIDAYHTINNDKGGKNKRDTHASFIHKSKGKPPKVIPKSKQEVNFADPKRKKDGQAGHILKTYLEQGARKRVLMNDKVYEKLKKEKDRPKSSTLKDVQAHILPQIEETFKRFWESQAEELGIDSKSLANMSKAELALRADNDPSLLTGWKKKGKGGGKSLSPRPSSGTGSIFSDDSWITNCSNKNKHKKSDGRAQPTRDDHMEFLVALNSAAAAGGLPLQMLHFHKYLVKHGPEDGFPLVEKDLLFYLEVHKFKDASHAFADEELLRRKVQSILDCYFDSAVPPTLQLDVPTELQQKTMRAIQRYLSGKDLNSALFDEAQYVTFKELLPYWAGFLKTWKPIEDGTGKRPTTKQERERMRRQEEFEKWKPPSAKTFRLPILPKGTAVAALTFSLTDGLKWKEGGGGEETFATRDRSAGFDTRRNSLLSNVESVMSEQSSIFA